MTHTVVLSGNPRPGSRTLKLATATGAAISAEPPLVIDVADLGPGLLTPGDPATAAAVAAVREAKLLVVATPTYKGSYTGVLKVLLDQLPAGALEGVTAVPVVTAGVQPQADGAERFLRHLLTELGANVAPALTATEPELNDIAGVADRYARSADPRPS
jgi:FMN reductase